MTAEHWREQLVVSEIVESLATNYGYLHVLRGLVNAMTAEIISFSNPSDPQSGYKDNLTYERDQLNIILMRHDNDN